MLGIALVVAVLGTLMVFVQVFAQTAITPPPSGTVTGYAWSGVAGAGWISLSCTNDNSCGTTNYGVVIDATGNWSGRGWSPNIGWVSFDGVAACGPRPSTNMTTGMTTGWAYLESASGTTGSQNGALTGCISMSGTAQNGATYGVTVLPQTGAISGFAWSGYDVATDTTGDGTNDWASNGIPNVGLGWIDFSFAQMMPHDDEDIPYVNIIGAPTFICEGQPASTVNIAYGNAAQCTLDGDIWQGSVPHQFWNSGNPAIASGGPIDYFQDLKTYAGTGSFTLTGTAVCTGATPNAQNVQASISVQYLPSTDPLCEGVTVDPPEQCTPGVDCFCDLNPGHQICTPECIADPALPQCTPSRVIPRFGER